MSSDNEMLNDARTFFSLAQEGGMKDILESDAPLKMGLDLDNKEIFIGVHDKVYFMDFEMASAMLHGLYLAIRTLEAAIKAEEN